MRYIFSVVLVIVCAQNILILPSDNTTSFSSTVLSWVQPLIPYYTLIGATTLVATTYAITQHINQNEIAQLKEIHHKELLKTLLSQSEKTAQIVQKEKQTYTDSLNVAESTISRLEKQLELAPAQIDQKEKEFIRLLNITQDIRGITEEQFELIDALKTRQKKLKKNVVLLTAKLQKSKKTLSAQAKKFATQLQEAQKLLEISNKTAFDNRKKYRQRIIELHGTVSESDSDQSK